MRMAWARVGVAAMVVGAGLTAAPALAADREFRAVVTSIEQRYALRHQRIPFLGLVSFCARVGSVGAVKGMDIAVFNDVSPGLVSEGLDAALDAKLGPSWHRFVSTREPESGETTFIYSRLDDRKFSLLIASLDGGSLSLVKLALSEKEMEAFVRREEWAQKRAHR